MCGRLPYKETIQLPRMTTISNVVIQKVAENQRKKPLPEIPKGEFVVKSFQGLQIAVKSFQGLQIAIFQYDLSETAGYSESASN